MPFVINLNKPVLPKFVQLGNPIGQNVAFKRAQLPQTISMLKPYGGGVNLSNVVKGNKPKAKVVVSVKKYLEGKIRGTIIRNTLPAGKVAQLSALVLEPIVGAQPAFGLAKIKHNQR